jgi:hypothetical protein
MGFNIDPTHHRYYVYQVTNPGPDNVIHYRTSTGDWSTDYCKAMLWDSEAFAVQKAKDCAKIISRTKLAFPDGAYVNVGRVTVVLDSQYSIQTFVGVVSPNFKE